jgi:hypothetical protein
MDKIYYRVNVAVIAVAVLDQNALMVLKAKLLEGGQRCLQQVLRRWFLARMPGNRKGISRTGDFCAAVSGTLPGLKAVAFLKGASGLESGGHFRRRIVRS